MSRGMNMSEVERAVWRVRDSADNALYGLAVSFAQGLGFGSLSPDGVPSDDDLAAALRQPASLGLLLMRVYQAMNLPVPPSVARSVVDDAHAAMDVTSLPAELADALIRVRRYWNDKRNIGTFRLADLRGFHWSEDRGLANMPSPRQFIYAYVHADRSVEGGLRRVAGDVDPVKVCVIKMDNEPAVVEFVESQSR